MRPIGTTCAPIRRSSTCDLAKVHATGYWSQCLKLADDAYMPKGPRPRHRLRPVVPRQEGRSGTSEGPQSLRWGRCSGDPVTTPDTSPLHVGDDKAVTNMPDGSVEMIKWREMNDWGPYLGWAPPYYK